MPPSVHIDGFAKSYGPVRAVKGISFDVEKAELFGLIGPDGAGKTTTMRTIVTLLHADEGAIAVEGMDARTDYSRIRSVIGYMPQRFSLYPDLSVDQNLRFFADLFGVPKHEIPARMERLYRFSRLEEFSGRLAGRLSGGMKQKLALSCTLIHNPLLLVLDEPTTGVDPVSRKEFWSILRELKSEGVTVLVSTPYMDEALLCDRIAIMHEGSLLAQGAPGSVVAGFRYAIYAIRERELVMGAAAAAGIEGVHSVHSFGDSLHITADPVLPEEQLHRRLSEAFGREVAFERIAPSLEDVFIDLIGRERHAA